jgi:hypothetical protein
MILNETQQKWANIITEEYGVKDQAKLSWMSQYAQNHEVFEGVQLNTSHVAGGIYATPLNTMGMGNPQMPMSTDPKTNLVGLPGGKFGAQQVGSGDIPMSTLTMALEVAAVTIGLELVPVIPANGPWAMLSYMDFPYAGGKYDAIGNLTSLDGKGPGAENKPIYIKVPAVFSNTIAEGETKSVWTKVKELAPQSKVVRVVDKTSGAKAEILGEYIGISRIDAAVIFQIKSVTVNGADGSIADAMGAATVMQIGTVSGEPASFAADYTSDTWTAGAVRADLVGSAADHVQGFANFYNGDADPMSRAENETGTGNTIGARMFTKLVQMGSYEVTGAVTRQQLQDMPLYGVDVIGKVLEDMQNRLSQSINNRILDRVFRLGVDNADMQYHYQGVDLNLYLNDVNGSGLALNKFDAYSKYLGMNGEPKFISSHVVPNAIQNTAAENVTTHQRRIMSRILAAANLIANVSRRGRGQWVVTNTQVLSALQDASAYVVAPMVNTLAQDGSQSLYFAGSVAGLNLYVDPYMKWDDTRVCVGRKSTGNDPGVIFMPYILADTVQIIAEGTMAPKLLVNSRFAIVDAGFHPEQSYYTFMVQTSGAGSFLI